MNQIISIETEKLIRSLPDCDLTITHKIAIARLQEKIYVNGLKNLTGDKENSGIRMSDNQIDWINNKFKNSKLIYEYILVLHRELRKSYFSFLRLKMSMNKTEFDQFIKEYIRKKTSNSTELLR